MLANVIKSIDKKSHKLPLMIGFLGKTLSREVKCDIIDKFKEYFSILEANIKNDINWKSSLYMSSYYLNKWYN